MNRSRGLLFTIFSLALGLSACDLTGSGSDSKSSESTPSAETQQCKQTCFDNNCQGVSGCTAVASCVAGCNGEEACVQQCGQGVSVDAIKGSNAFYACSDACDNGTDTGDGSDTGDGTNTGIDPQVCVNQHFAACLQDTACAALARCATACSDESCRDACGSASTNAAVNMFNEAATKAGVCLCNACVNLCDGDAACAQLNSCYVGCGTNDSSCQNSCENQSSPAARSLYSQAASCYAQYTCRSGS